MRPPICLVTAILLNVLLSSCETDVSTVKMIRPDTFPAETGTGVEMIYSDSGRVKVKVVAPRLERYETPVEKMILPQGVFIEFYNDSLKVKSWLKADYGISYQGQEKMEVRRNVVVMNEKGEKMETEQLTWSKRDGKIFTSEPVTIRRENEIVHGKGLEANQDFSTYTILDVIGTTYIEEMETDSAETRRDPK